MKHDIFISYRRDGGFETANLIASKLRFAGYRVFLDIHAMHEGDFSIQLEEKVRQCKDFIWVLAPSNIQNADGSFSKISTLKFRKGVDYYRDEICWAIKYKKNIVPVILNGFEYDESFPPEISNSIQQYNPQLDIKKLQSVEALKNQYFDAAISELKKYLHSKAIIKWCCISLGGLLLVSVLIFAFYISQFNHYDNCIVSLQEKYKHAFIFEGGEIELTIDNYSLGTKKIYTLNDDVIYTHINHKYMGKDAIVKFKGKGYNSVCDTIKLAEQVKITIERDDTYERFWGTILDENTNIPIENVTITIGEKSVVTDKNGKYHIDFNIEEQSTYKLFRATKIGYETFVDNNMYPGAENTIQMTPNNK